MTTVDTRGFHFESQDKIEQIAKGRKTFREEMEVVWHQAVGMDGEVSGDGLRTESFEDVTTFCRIGEQTAAMEAADGYEVEVVAEIGAGWQADVLVMEHLRFT